MRSGARASHRPSFVMPMGTASYFSWSSALITDAAEISETSCSPDRPPNSMPMRSRFFSVVIRSSGYPTSERLFESVHVVMPPRSEATRNPLRWATQRPLRLAHAPGVPFPEPCSYKIFFPNPESDHFNTASIAVWLWRSITGLISTTSARRPSPSLSAHHLHGEMGFAIVTPPRTGVPTPGHQ